jgi:hypothetical protein
MYIIVLMLLFLIKHCRCHCSLCSILYSTVIKGNAITNPIIAYRSLCMLLMTLILLMCVFLLNMSVCARAVVCVCDVYMYYHKYLKSN